MTILESITTEFRRYKTLADRGIAQISDDDLRMILGDGENSIAIIVAHMGGNLQSRFTEFLTTDGEKPWRKRDEEFHEKKINRNELLDTWEKGWACVFEALAPLSDADLARIVYIRGEAHTVIQALNRALGHAAYHTGQIVQLARHFAAENWQSLSIPKGESAQYNQYMRAKASPQQA